MEKTIFISYDPAFKGNSNYIKTALLSAALCDRDTGSTIVCMRRAPRWRVSQSILSKFAN